ncbi:transposase [Streptomyces noursei]|uniref:transposase n=1 Tax=Streptomyces noursei TaxID=1971 RepID=UPI0035E0D814
MASSTPALWERTFTRRSASAFTRPPILLPHAPEAVARCRTCRILDGEHHRSKWCLALAMLDKLAGIGLRPAILVAETRYDANADFRHDLEACGLGYVLQVKAR